MLLVYDRSGVTLYISYTVNLEPTKTVYSFFHNDSVAEGCFLQAMQNKFIELVKYHKVLS